MLACGHETYSKDLRLRVLLTAAVDGGGQPRKEEATMSRNIARLPGEWPLKKRPR